MKRALSLLALLLLPILALADGMVVRHVAVPAEVSIPDQRALICFSNSVERLVIETRFTGEGTNFAWIVPLPSQPVIEEATTGLFPTLQYLFQPRVTHYVTRYYIGFLTLAVFFVLCAFAFKTGTSLIELFALGFIGLVMAAMLLPAMGGAKAAASNSAGNGVAILDRKIVGIFETVTIASADPTALQRWFDGNGFAAPTNAAPIIASYVKDGWIFAAAKVRRENSAVGTNSPHPLSFTFKTAKPVYPMRLTALNSDSLKVDLYVFAEGLASAKYFKTERCTKPEYPTPPEERWLSSNWRTIHVVHPLLRDWSGHLPVVTKLTATLSRREMKEDIQIELKPFAEKHSDLYSYAGAGTIAINLAVGVFIVGALTLFIFAWLRRDPSTYARPIATIAFVSLAIGGLVYIALPKTEVKLLRRGLVGLARESSFAPVIALNDHTNLTFSETREVLEQISKEAFDSPIQYSSYRRWENILAGGRMRYEDSPGNYTLRETTNGLECIVYDAQGASHVMRALPR